MVFGKLLNKQECEITRNVEWRNPLTGENEIRPINEIASSHMARRTFIGNAYFKVTDPNLIGKMSGHVEGSKAFKRYRKIEDETLKKCDRPYRLMAVPFYQVSATAFCFDLPTLI